MSYTLSVKLVKNYFLKSTKIMFYINILYKLTILYGGGDHFIN